jgi:hypothetical protein
MTEPLYSHVSVHLLRFADVVTVDDLGELEVPAGTSSWLTMVDVSLGENLLAERAGNVWGIVGCHSSGEAADTTVTLASELLPILDDTVESWQATFDVVGHRGEVDWLDRQHPGLALAPVAADPGGPLAVMTTAGFVVDENFDFARAQDFSLNVDRVRGVLDASPGNVLTHVLQAAEPAGPDGITFTLWRGDETMRDAAYRPGPHREQLDRYKAEHTADRTSFTRLRARTSAGNWNGVDPIDAANAAV